MSGQLDWRKLGLIGGLTFLATPLNVWLHEWAHMLALTLGGIPAHLVALGEMTPMGFAWTFEGLRAAQAHYGASNAAVVAGALAGPLFTLAVGYAGLWAFRRWHALPLWAVAASAVGRRSVLNLLFLTPKVIAGSINSSDEAIAAFFLGWPVGSLWWLLVVDLLCLVLLIAALPRPGRWRMATLGFISGFVGFFVIEYLVNTLVFHLASWER